MTTEHSSGADETLLAAPSRAKPALRAGRDPHLNRWKRSRRRRLSPPGPLRLTEWHAMDQGQRESAWAQLLAWVNWLHDRYELSVEERLPHCWAQHPGLIEELWALKAWREEVYQADQPSGQAARYWHAEMRQTVNAATTFYAAGCRAGHRGAALAPSALLERWSDADPLAGIPPHLLTTRTHPAPADTEVFRSEATMHTALTDGRARYLSQTIHDFLHHDHSWWTPTGSGWLRITDQHLSTTLDQRSEQMARADAHVTRASKLRDLLEGAPTTGSTGSAPGTTPTGH
jgi:hypothetical protein